MSRFVPLAIGLLLAGCAAGDPIRSASMAPVVSPEQAERPTWRVGDRWIRTDGTFRVARVESDRYVLESGDQTIHMSHDLVLIRHVGQSTAWEFTPAPALDWPLVVGKRGSGRGTIRLPDGRGGDGRLGWAVEAREEIDVPAGRFTAFRVVFTAELGQSLDQFGSERGRGRPTSFSHTVWYAPSTRRWIKAESGSAYQWRWEVEAIDPDEGAPIRIAMESPRDASRVREFDGSEATGRVESGNGVAYVSVHLNRRLVWEQHVAEPDRKTVTFRAVLQDLVDGRNVVVVAALDRRGNGTVAAHRVYYETATRIEVPPPGSAARVSRVHVLLVWRVAEPNGIAWVAVSINDGERFADWYDGKTQATIEVPLTLVPGENRLTTRVADVDGHVRRADAILIVDADTR